MYSANLFIIITGQMVVLIVPRGGKITREKVQEGTCKGGIYNAVHN